MKERRGAASLLEQEGRERTVGGAFRERCGGTALGKGTGEGGVILLR